MASAVTAGLFLLGFPVKARLEFSSRQRTRCFPLLLPVVWFKNKYLECVWGAAWKGLLLFTVSKLLS